MQFNLAWALFIGVQLVATESCKQVLLVHWYLNHNTLALIGALVTQPQNTGTSMVITITATMHDNNMIKQSINLIWLRYIHSTDSIQNKPINE
jgi:hypothetical protein